MSVVDAQNDRDIIKKWKPPKTDKKKRKKFDGSVAHSESGREGVPKFCVIINLLQLFPGFSKNKNLSFNQELFCVCIVVFELIFKTFRF